MMKRKAQVTLQQDAINRLVQGKIVTIRFEDAEIEIRFDSTARLGGGSIDDMFADILRSDKFGTGRRG